MRIAPTAALLAVAALAAGSPAQAAEVPSYADYFEEFFPSDDGTTLHADVLRPKGLPRDARTPVILTVSPYTGHSGASGPTDTAYDPQAGGPSSRFFDLLDGGKPLQRGYTYVMVELRGFGGSAGCNDWGGPGEQADVEAAVEWAAAQPWSTGKVALWGKSYDGWTGLMGLVARPKGLAAVVAMEPVYDGYRYLYSDGVRFTNSVGTPALFQLSDLTSVNVGSGSEYLVNSLVPDPACLALNQVQQSALDDPASPFWVERALVPRAKDTDVPLLMTQGFLEDNTKPDGAFAFFNATTGPKRAWLGMFDHVRPSDVTAQKKPLMGRDPRVWWDESMRWLDHYVRGVPLADAPVDRDAPVVVGGSDGTWRSEAMWPPLDAERVSTLLRTGSYADDGANEGSGPNGGQGLWSISPPLPHDAHLAGEPRLVADIVTVAPRANLVGNVYDIDASGKATLVSRGAMLLRAPGRVTLDLYGNDWRFAAGHRIGVLLSGANAEWWTHLPTNTDVDVHSARIDLPFLRYARSADQPGGPPVKLTGYRVGGVVTVTADALRDGLVSSFALPPALTARPAAPVAPQAPPRRARRLVARIGTSRRRVVVFGNAPSGARVTVALRRGSRTVARRTVTARLGAFRTTIRVRRAGRYRASVTARRGTLVLRARTATKRVR